MAWTRTAYTLLAGLTLLLVTLQFLTVGLSLFGVVDDFDLHEGVGRLVEGVTLLLVIVSLVGRLGRPFTMLAVALFVLAMIQGFLPTLRDDADIVAALHPLNALVLWYVAHIAFSRSRAAASPAAPEPAA